MVLLAPQWMTDLSLSLYVILLKTYSKAFLCIRTCQKTADAAKKIHIQASDVTTSYVTNASQTEELQNLQFYQEKISHSAVSVCVC